MGGMNLRVRRNLWSYVELVTLTMSESYSVSTPESPETWPMLADKQQLQQYGIIFSLHVELGIGAVVKRARSSRSALKYLLLLLINYIIKFLHHNCRRPEKYLISPNNSATAK